MTTVNNLLILALLVLSVCCESRKEPDSQYALLHRVTDYADILTTEQEDSLITMIENLETNIGSQIAILTMRDLNGQKIEEVSLKTANATRLGRATHNDGVLITVAYQDRKMRIEVGTGLKNILTDEIAAEIISEDMAPRFKEGKFSFGLSVAIQKITSLIEINADKILLEPVSN